MAAFDSTSVTYCITCKGRAAHIKQTLPRNLADNPLSKFVLLDYGSEDDLQRYIVREHWRDIESGQLNVYILHYAGVFRMAHAKNIAHRLGIREGGQILVNLDADNFTGWGFTDYVVNQFSEHGPRSFLWADMIKGVLPRGISGRIAVTAQAFVSAGGYDERFETWAHDDKDFNRRLHLLGYQGHAIAPCYLNAMRHNDKVRFREYPHARTAEGEEELEAAEQEPARAIANFGVFGCGSLSKVGFEGTVKLDPLPTRIFGIGMHKTGTTSLHAALRILGFDSAHWKSPQWAYGILNSILQGQPSPTVDRHYALSDLPMPLIYRALDWLYPGSKFILTIRDEDTWLDSVGRHFSAEHNPYRSSWDQEPYSNAMHEMVYGRQDFDAGTFRLIYRQRNAEMLEYFARRPDDLLVMYKHEWGPLCGFLNRAVPSIEYPWRNGMKG